MADMVNHPSHYNQFKREVIEEMRLLFGDFAVKCFCQLSAYKYIRRADFKGHKEQDLAKAEWYMDYVAKMNDEREIKYNNCTLESTEDGCGCSFVMNMPNGKLIDDDTIEELTKKIDKMQIELAKYKLGEDRDPNLEA